MRTCVASNNIFIVCHYISKTIFKMERSICVHKSKVTLESFGSCVELMEFAMLEHLACACMFSCIVFTVRAVIQDY